MRGSRAKQLRRLAKSMGEAEFANEVIVQEVKKPMAVIDPKEMMGFRIVEVPVMLRQHHPKSQHNIVQVLKKSYRRYIKDGRPNEALVGAM